MDLSFLRRLDVASQPSPLVFVTEEGMFPAPARMRAALIDQMWAFPGILGRPALLIQELARKSSWHGTCNLGSHERKHDSLKVQRAVRPQLSSR